VGTQELRCTVCCRARNAAMTQWRATGGGGPTPRAGDARGYLQRASLTAFDRDEEREHDKDQARRLHACPKP
jgi:hypothetical protein